MHDDLRLMLTEVLENQGDWVFTEDMLDNMVYEDVFMILAVAISLPRRGSNLSNFVIAILINRNNEERYDCKTEYPIDIVLRNNRNERVVALLAIFAISGDFIRTNFDKKCERFYVRPVYIIKTVHMALGFDNASIDEILVLYEKYGYMGIHYLQLMMAFKTRRPNVAITDERVDLTIDMIENLTYDDAFYYSINQTPTTKETLKYFTKHITTATRLNGGCGDCYPICCDELHVKIERDFANHAVLVLLRILLEPTSIDECSLEYKVLYETYFLDQELDPVLLSEFNEKYGYPHKVVNKLDYTLKKMVGEPEVEPVEHVRNMLYSRVKSARNK